MPNVNHNPYPQLAGNVDLGSFEPTYVFAGEKQIVTQPFPVGATALVQYQAVALDATNKLVPHDPTHFERVLRQRIAHPLTLANAPVLA